MRARAFNVRRKKKKFFIEILKKLGRSRDESSPTSTKGKPLLIAWEDGSFPMTCRGNPGGSPALQIRNFLAKHTIVVLIPAYHTTKKCPHCKEPGMDFVVHPKGNVLRRKRNGEIARGKDGKPLHIEVRGLSRCDKCHTLWARDFASTMNIYHVFTQLIFTGSIPDYLKVDHDKKKWFNHHLSIRPAIETTA